MSRIRASDWDELFAPGAPRRGGPLRALVTSVLVLALIGIVGVVGTLVVQRTAEQREAQATAAVIFAQTSAPLQTSTAQAANLATATRFAIRTATAAVRAGQATPVPAPGGALAARTVARDGNLRSEPRIDPATVAGLVIAGDQLTVLEEQTVAGQVWYRVQITSGAANRTSTAAPIGTVGWVSAALLT